MDKVKRWKEDLEEAEQARDELEEELRQMEMMGVDEDSEEYYKVFCELQDAENYVSYLESMTEDNL